jgi:thiosulfate dehydrogenase [quinone] large subunit
MTGPMTSPRNARLTSRSWPQDVFRVVFGVIWGIDAVLKWLPGFRSTYVAAITGVAKGQPSWLNWWFDFWVKLQTPRPAFFAYLVAVLETLVALAIIFGFARKLTYISSAVFGLVIWGVAEGFGGPYMTGSSDIGTAIIYAVVSMGLLHRAADLVVAQGGRDRSPRSHCTHALDRDPRTPPAGRSRVARLGDRRAQATSDAMTHFYPGSQMMAAIGSRSNIQTNESVTS